MKKGTPDAKELAFRVYAEHGGINIPLILENLKHTYKLEITERTLYEWKQAGDWKARVKRAMEEKREFQEGELLGLEERMMGKLLKQIERYEGHMHGPEIDNQAAYAYVNMIRIALELAGRIRPETRLSPEEMKRRIDEVLEAEYGIKRRPPAGNMPGIC
jgi:hypothetical protein